MPTKKPDPAPVTPAPTIAQPEASLAELVVAPQVKPKAAPKTPGPIELALGDKFDSKAEYFIAGDRQAGRFSTITSTLTGEPVYTKVGQLDDGRGIYTVSKEGHPQ